MNTRILAVGIACGLAGLAAGAFGAVAVAHRTIREVNHFSNAAELLLPLENSARLDVVWDKPEVLNQVLLEGTFSNLRYAVCGRRLFTPSQLERLVIVVSKIKDSAAVGSPYWTKNFSGQADPVFENPRGLLDARAHYSICDVFAPTGVIHPAKADR